MSDYAHLIWLAVAAVVVGAVLTIGTLLAAELVPRRRRRETTDETREQTAR